MSPDVSEEMSPASISISTGGIEDERLESRLVRCLFAGGIRRESVSSSSASILGSRSSVLTSSANSLDAWEESGDADAESAISLGWGWCCLWA